MKRLGIIGGLGPESTIAYYRAVLDEYRRVAPDRGLPPVLIDSIDLDRMVRMVNANDLAGMAAYLVEELRALAAAGVTLGLISANTPHIVFDEVARESPLPLVSIVEAACAAVQRAGLARVALIGTRFTMQGRFYPDVFARSGVELVVPQADEQEFIHQKYMTELLEGRFLPHTRAALLDIVGRLKERDAVEAVLLAGTELPLILTEPIAFGIPVLDTTRLHVRAAVERLWGPTERSEVQGARCEEKPHNETSRGEGRARRTSGNAKAQGTA